MGQSNCCNCCNCSRIDDSEEAVEKEDHRHHSNVGHSHRPDMNLLVLWGHSRSSTEDDRLVVAVVVEESILGRSSCRILEDYFETAQCI